MVHDYLVMNVFQVRFAHILSKNTFAPQLSVLQTLWALHERLTKIYVAYLCASLTIFPRLFNCKFVLMQSSVTMILDVMLE